MKETICHTGRGRLYGISNDLAQPGKSVTLYDGTTILCRLPLDEVFPDRVETFTDEQGTVTDKEAGIVLNCIFTTELRVESDGTLEVYWSAPD
jgi:hypothetical protein